MQGIRRFEFVVVGGVVLYHPASKNHIAYFVFLVSLITVQYMRLRRTIYWLTEVQLLTTSV